MAGLKLVLIFLVCAAVAAPLAVESITCGAVAKSVIPCLSYLQSNGVAPPPSACCNGVKGLLASAKTTPDRQSICNCLKTLANSNKINTATAGKLPSACGVSIPYPISTSTNCANIK